MLTGGILVRGIYCLVTASEVLNKLLASFQHILRSVSQQQPHHRLRQQSQQHKPEETTQIFSDDMILMTSVLGSEKFNCKMLNFQGTQAKIIPIEWKFRSFLSEFQCFEAAWQIDCTIPIYNSSESIKMQIESILSKEWEHIVAAEALLDGNIVDTTVSHTTKEKKRKKKELIQQKNSYIVELLKPPFNGTTFNNNITYTSGKKSLNKVSSADIPQPVVGIISIIGSLWARAFVHSLLSLTIALQYLKEDIYNSLWSRFELFCDELENSHHEQDVDKHQKYFLEKPTALSTACQWVLPRRVFVNFKLPLTLCDYLMPHEVEEDCLERFRALLSFDATKNSIVFVEVFAQSLIEPTHHREHPNFEFQPSQRSFQQNTDPGDITSHPTINAFKDEKNTANLASSTISYSKSLKQSNDKAEKNESPATNEKPNALHLLVLLFIVFPLLILFLSFLMSKK